MADEYLDLVNKKKAEFSDLFNRMDADKKLLTLSSYTMQDKDGRDEPDVDNITMNDAAIYADMVHTTLIRAEVSPEVEGEHLKDKETSLVENFIRDIELEADTAISNNDIPSFKNWEVMQACDRGRIARRITLRLDEEDDNKLAKDCFTAIDTRYLLYEPSIYGYKWVASELPRSKEDIKEEYDIDIPGTSAIVTDFWDKEVNCVYVGKERVKEEDNYYKEPPFVIEVVPFGLLTMDDDRILYSGESIFAKNRTLYAEKNLFGTIMKSLTVRSFFNGLQLEVNDVALAKKPKEPPYGKKFVVPVEKGTKGYFSMPIEDLNNAAQMFYSMIDSALQEGALPKVSYGNLQFPLTGVAITSLKEAEDSVYFPRIQGLTKFWQRVYRMVIKQYIAQKLNIELGEEGFRNRYGYKDLDLSYSIKFHYFVSSPKEDMVNISTAAAVGDLVSDDTKMRDYLHIKDPTVEGQKKLAEKAARMSPAVAMYDTIKALFDQGEKIKANIMATEMGFKLDELLSGNMGESSNPLGMGQKPTQLMPLFNGAGGGIRTPESPAPPEQGIPQNTGGKQ